MFFLFSYFVEKWCQICWVVFQYACQIVNFIWKVLLRIRTWKFIWPYFFMSFSCVHQSIYLEIWYILTWEFTSMWKCEGVFICLCFPCECGIYLPFQDIISSDQCILFVIALANQKSSVLFFFTCCCFRDAFAYKIARAFGLSCPLFVECIIYIVHKIFCLTYISVESSMLWSDAYKRWHVCTHTHMCRRLILPTQIHCTT